eukprot:629726-Ditylum_brightwellii.AAC.1
MDLDSNKTAGSSASTNNTSRTYTDHNVVKEGWEIKRNGATWTTKTPNEATYNTDKEDKSKNDNNSLNTGEPKKRRKVILTLDEMD